MSNTVEDILFRLHLEPDEASSETFVKTIHGDMVRMNRELWEESPVLREHAAVSCVPCVELSSPKNALMDLNRAHRDGFYPIGARESYELLAAASELELKEMTSKCFENLRFFNALDESVELPPELSVDTVTRVFRILMSGPLRTDHIYKRQLSKIAKYCAANNQDVMTEVREILKQSLEKFKGTGLEGIPASFEVRSVPVVIYKRNGKLQTAVIIGAEVKPVNLFGNRINLENIQGPEFYLKYGVYLLYLCCNSVYYKNLLDDSEPKEVLSGCSSLITRGNFVFASHTEKNRNSLSLWTNDEKFERIYQSKRDIDLVQFDYRTCLLAVLSAGKLLLFRLENKTLFLLEEREYLKVIDVFMSGSDVFIVRRTNKGRWIESFRVETTGYEESGRSSDESAAEEDTMTRIKNPTSQFWVRHLGGSYYRVDVDTRRLQLMLDFPSLVSIKTVLTNGELAGFSELWMSP